MANRMTQQFIWIKAQRKFSIRSKMTTASAAEEDDGSSHLLSFCLCEVNMTGMVLSARVLDMFDRMFVSVRTQNHFRMKFFRN